MPDSERYGGMLARIASGEMKVNDPRDEVFSKFIPKDEPKDEPRDDGPEYYDDHGQRLEVVRDPQPQGTGTVDDLTADQKSRLFEMYKVIAREMPLEGRDYRVGVTPVPGSGDRISVSLIPLNDFGRYWCRHLSVKLSEAFSGKAGGDKQVSENNQPQETSHEH